MERDFSAIRDFLFGERNLRGVSIESIVSEFDERNHQRGQFLLFRGRFWLPPASPNKKKKSHFENLFFFIVSVFVLRHPAEVEPKGSRKGVESKPKWSQTRVLRPSRVRMAASCRPRHRQSKHTSVPWLPTSSSYLSLFFFILVCL